MNFPARNGEIACLISAFRFAVHGKRSSDWIDRLMEKCRINALVRESGLIGGKRLWFSGRFPAQLRDRV